MKKWLSVLLVLLLLCSLCGVTAMAEDAEELPGVFAMVKMVSDEDGDMTDQLKALVALGMAPTLTIEEDGSAELDLFGETETIKFDFDAGTVDVGNDVVVPYPWEDEVLSFGGDGILFAFSKNASADVEKGVGPFRYYTLADITDGSGKSITDEFDEEWFATVTLTVFQAGDGYLEDSESRIDVVFDFENMTLSDGSDSDPMPVSQEDTTLSIAIEEDEILVFEQADPGRVGPYELVSFGGEDEETLNEQLAVLKAMSMLPTLTIKEDDSAVMSLMGEEVPMSFDFDSMTVTSEGDEEAVEFSYEYGTLSIGNGDDLMIFARVMPKADAE